MFELDIMKQAKPDFEIFPLISKRWSPRAYNGKPVEKEKLQRIFEAARWSPSAYNAQPWRFIVGFKGDKVYENIFKTLVDFNQQWVKTAPALVVTLCNSITPKGELNRTAAYDLGQSVAMLSLQATHEGVHVHQMSGFDTKAAAKTFEIPENFEVVSAFTLGYLGDITQLPDFIQTMEQAPRTRLPLKDFVWEAFGKEVGFLKG